MPPSDLNILIDQPAEVNNPLSHRVVVDSSDNTSVNIPGSSFTAGHRYLLIFSCTLATESYEAIPIAYLVAPDGSGVADTMRISVWGLTFSYIAAPKQLFFADVFTADGSTPATMHLTEIGIGSSSSATYSHPRLMAIDLDTTAAFENNGILNETDWSYNQNDNSGSSVISNTWTNKGSTKINADGVSDYLVLAWGSMHKTAGGLTSRPQMRMRLGSSLVIAQNADTISANGGNDWWQLNCMALLKAGGLNGGYGQIIPPLTAGVHDIYLDFKGDSLWANEYVTTVVFRLSRFAAVEASYVDYGILGPGYVCTEGDEADNPLPRTTRSCELISGMSAPDVEDAFGSGSEPRDRISLFRFEAEVSGSRGAEHTRMALYEADTDVDDCTFNSDWWLAGDDADIITGTGFYVDQGVVPSQQNLAPTWRVGGDTAHDTSTFRQALYVSFYTTLASLLEYFEAEFFYAVTHGTDFDAQFRYATTYQRSSSLSVAIAQARSKISSMSITIAELRSRTGSLNVAVAHTHESPLSMSITLSGSQYILEVLNVAVAVNIALDSLLEVLIASTAFLTADLNLAVTDAAQIVIEQDRPKALPFIEIDDLETS